MSSLYIIVVAVCGGLIWTMRRLPGMDLKGKRVLITGASRGIGESLAHAFAGAGAIVALVARSEDAIQTLAAELGGTAHPADLSDPTQVATLIQRVEDEAGPVDVLVNNAGLDAVGAFADAPSDELRQVTEVNYLAPAELCRQAIPRMLSRGSGRHQSISRLGQALSYSPASWCIRRRRRRCRTSQRGCELTCGGYQSVRRSWNSDLSSPTCSRTLRTTSRQPNHSSGLTVCGLTVQVPRERVAEEVVRAVQKDRRHVRVPKRTAAFAR